MKSTDLKHLPPARSLTVLAQRLGGAEADAAFMVVPLEETPAPLTVVPASVPASPLLPMRAPHGGSSAPETRLNRRSVIVTRKRTTLVPLLQEPRGVLKKHELRRRRMVHNQWFSARVLIYSVLAAMVLTGCSFFNPYIEPDLPRPGLKRSVEGKPVLDENNHGQPTRVSVGQVREYARSLQDAYRQAAAGQSKTRTVLDLTALSSAAAAIGLAATGGSAEAVGLLGLSAATVFLGGDRLLVATRKKIYFQGALALECVIGATVANPMPSVDADRLGVQLRLLGSERRRLESAINEFKMQVKRVQPTGPEQETATKAIKELRCGKVDKEILS